MTVRAQGDSTPPKALAQPVPPYPAGLKEQRVVGSASVRFLIDAQGDVQEVQVQTASRDEFGRAAAAGVARWKYQPATKAGQPVALRVGVVVEFTLTPDELANLEANRRKEVLPPGPDPLPVEALDEWPELKKEIRPKTPAALREKRRMGQAIMAFIVDETGVPRDIHPVVVTDVECGVEAAAAVAKWRFKPGLKAGQAVRVAMEVPIAFFPENTAASGFRVKPGVKRAQPPDGVEPAEAGVNQPEVVKREVPDYPSEMSDRNAGGEVTVHLVINDRGVVTHVISTGATNAFFATVAERAVSYWRFKPAMKNGQPVTCRVSMPMKFGMRY